MEYAELPKVAKETCYEHDWQGIGECPECVDVWATALAERTNDEERKPRPDNVFHLSREDV